jgi:serine/threonine protein kinase
VSAVIGRHLGHYAVVEALGAGGMGEVYRATDRRLGRDVALKILPSELQADAEGLERFRREARALAAIDHPSIVTVYSVEEADGVPFLTMQLVEGQSLQDVIAGGELPIARIVAIGLALAEALATAHERAIVHRDLKPANVMIARSGQVKVLDFGLAKFAADGGAAGDDTVSGLATRDGVVMGTLPYMSPEQVRGQHVDHRTDVYSLGVVMYFVFTGREPFVGDTPSAIAYRHIGEPPRPPRDINPGIPGWLNDLILRAMAKDREQRFSSMGDLAAALEAGLAAAPAAAAATS